MQTIKFKLVAFFLTLFVFCCLPLTLYLASIDFTTVSLRAGPAPDFSRFDNATEKKQAFHDYFSNIVEKQNQRIEYRRNQFQRLKQKVESGKTLTRREKNFLTSLQKRYNIDKEASIEKKVEVLELRMHPIPKSLVLAQAANESAWGTSRFAVEGNNYFGQWCFKKGCGLVPQNRGDGKVHEVRKFDSPAESVSAYFKNINTHRAYRQLRKTRKSLIESDRKITGSVLAEGLVSYSERGHEYVKEIQQMIRINEWEKTKEKEQ